MQTKLTTGAAPSTRTGDHATVLGVQDAFGGAVLARLIEESWDVIGDEWVELLASAGLPHQRRIAQEEPAALRSTYTRIVGYTVGAVGLPSSRRAQRSYARLLKLYETFGREWAERDLPPGRAAEAPRITQAIWRVISRPAALTLNPSELVACVTALNALAMDLAMARVSGYLSHKEGLLRAQRESVSRLLDELTQVETKHRKALALELHDHLAQQLASVLNGIQYCERLVHRDEEMLETNLAQVKQTTRDAIKDVRTTIRDLRFGIASQGGGIAALGEYLEDLESDTGIVHEVRTSDDLPELPPTQEAQVLRIIQQALTNAHRHSHAGRIAVVVERSGDALSVSVSDDGCGFDLAEALALARKRGRLGLIGMQERAEFLGATLDIASKKDLGTSVRLRLPRAAG